MAHEYSNTYGLHRTYVQAFLKSEELQVQRVFNDDFMGLKRIFAALVIIYLTE